MPTEQQRAVRTRYWPLIRSDPVLRAAGHNPFLLPGRPALPGAVRRRHPGSMGVERASNTDLGFLAMDRGGVPEQFAAVLKLDRRIDPRTAEQVLATRIAGLPRLRQRLVRTPPGCGRPIWVDDEAFHIGRHVRWLRTPTPGDETALLDVVLPLVTERLPRDRPLWRAAVVDGTAIVFVVHHVLADGIGGLALLSGLADRPAPPQSVPFPRRRPGAVLLAADAARARAGAVRNLARSCRLLRRSMTAGGGLRPERVAPSSLLRPTGPRRRAVTAHVDLGRLREVAHRHHGTANAALVSAVAGGLGRLLTARGEQIGTLAVAVPVAGRSAAAPGDLGNMVSPMLMHVPVTAAPSVRIARIAGAVRSHRHLATGPPPFGLLGPAFRLAAVLGGYRWYMNRQRRLHTVVSHVRGPEQPLHFAGALIRTIVPVAVGTSGSITVAFQAISYAGTLTVTAVADPDQFPDLADLAEALQQELDSLVDDDGGRAALSGG
ncbi:MAG TPA: wax ester/triacylglycerol synthase domain-containing protein [Pilimelia sp.]|nr:wax ester/triacylglycerol synthase domain-containing protein [Pilimelia sp.]